ncbi:ABC transporter permease [Tenggerimyces flavus]|uniref:ABC transporter permease n=1 Tax=Tenggerimyces flavus TaxID=1708749 RepID=A0ABV7YMB0_9ACTN|nr:ABC transporter permease [Tenggerimyces flavus]MBM7787649.1 ABC-type lipoprotein release transport system permease subunit [Tenggerimyces flavus]
MTLLSTWLGIELRRRWRSLVVLALLVAVASCTVLAATAGARREQSVLPRLLANTLPNDGIVVPNDPDFNWEKVRALPSVEALAEIALNGPAVEGIPFEETKEGMPAVADAEIMNTIERPIVFEGRLADPTRVDEVVLTPAFAKNYGYGVGDTLTLRTYKPETIDEAYDTPDAPPPDGPSQEVRVVGVVRGPWFSDEPGSFGTVVTTGAFFDKYKANIVGAVPSVPVNAIVRLKDGAAGLPEFRRQLAGAVGKPIDVWSTADDNARTQSTLNFLALSLLAFGITALLAALFLIGQALARYTAGSVADLLVLRPLGLTPRQVVVSATAPPAIAGLAGALLGIGGALVVSIWMPFGDAALLEPAPGLSADWLVLGVGGLLAVLAVAAGAAGTAWIALLASYSTRPVRRSMLAAAATRLGLPVPVVIGTRFALEPGRDRGTVPVRPAIIGAVTGVLGVLAAFTFSAGVADATRSLERFGQTHELQAEVGWGEPKPLPALAGWIAKWRADPDVVSVTDAPSNVAEAGDSTLTVFSYGVRPGSPMPTVMSEGRLPRTAGEISIGPTTAKELHATVGSKLLLLGSVKPRAEVSVKVTGIGFLPESPHSDYSEGSWMTADGYRALFGTAAKFHSALFDLRAGADVEAVASRLKEPLPKPLKGAIYPPRPPLQALLLYGIQLLPAFLGGFLGVLALGAVGHAIATAARRRRHEVAVLRALGMTRWQARVIVITQASVLAAIGLVFGIPLGIAIGRILWRVVADITPLEYAAPVAALASLLIVPVALLVANLLALWPGRLAAGMRVGQVLRAE